jgi:alpha-glucosidase
VLPGGLTPTAIELSAGLGVGRVIPNAPLRIFEPRRVRDNAPYLEHDGLNSTVVGDTLPTIPRQRLFRLPRWLVLVGTTLLTAATVPAFDAPPPGHFTPIGDLVSFARDEHGVTLQCADRSEVRITVLVSDLVRVRAALRTPLAAKDASWAIARTDWPATTWSFRETPENLAITTDELDVVVRRAPLTITFRDRKTQRVIDADERPLSSDAETGAVMATRRLGLEERFYGLGEKTGHLEKRRGSYTMWTSDTPAYHADTDPLYQTIPFYLGWENGAAFGVFFDNSYRSVFDFGKIAQDAATFSAEGGEINYYFFWGPSLQKVLGRYADLTGHMPMPPEWALGHQQSRYSYFNSGLAKDIVRRYQADDLPLDVLYLDIHYMDGYRDFTWNRERFPDPDALIADLGRQGVKVVTIVDPGVKFQPPTKGSSDAAAQPELAPHDQSYYVFNQGLAHGYFLKRTNGDFYHGRVWPGDSVFVDYGIDAASHWWGDLHRGLLDHGVAGIWTDMNEPSDFIDKSGKSQADVVWSDGSPYAKMRNVFALGMARATYEGLARLRPNQRPFVITRSGYAGIQRYSTMWTGDNNSTWEALAGTIPMFQSLGLSGEPFIGSDVPGFMGRADGELMVRWYEAAFLTPFCRNHANNNAYDHEPWRFGPYYEGVVRKFLKLRYRLLPFLYTTLEEAHRTGVPLFRPLVLNYQTDENTLDIDDQYMVGSDLLAAPVLLQGGTNRRVYLPPGDWYDFWNGEKHAGGTMIQVEVPLETTPLFARGGSVIPLGPEMNHVGEKPDAPIALHIYPGADGSAHGSWYEDDGVSPDYTRGVFRRTEITYRRSGAAATIATSGTGEFHSEHKLVELVVHSANAPRVVTIDGQSLPSGEPDAGVGSWSHNDHGTTIRITGDPKDHVIELK